ncbi:MAG: hypothetical protein AAGA81_08220 [Acidobacteriota bacterium]
MIRTKKGLPMLLLTVALVAVGCASGGGGAAAPAGPTDEEMIQEIIANSLDALKAKDIDSMMSTYSDDFSSNQGMDKAGMAQFLKQADEMGMLDGVNVDTSAMTTTIEGDTAEVAGISLEGAFGALALGFKLEKREGAWVVTYQEQN